MVELQRSAPEIKDVTVLLKDTSTGRNTSRLLDLNLPVKKMI